MSSQLKCRQDTHYSLLQYCYLQCHMLCIVNVADCCCRTQQNKIPRSKRRICKIVRNDKDVHDPVIVYRDRCRSLATKIIKDKSHPLNGYYSFLPHGRLLVLLCRTKGSNVIFYLLLLGLLILSNYCNILYAWMSAKPKFYGLYYIANKQSCLILSYLLIT